MAEKRIDDSKLGGISGGANRVEPEPGGGTVGLARDPGSVPVTPKPGGQTLPESDAPGSGNSDLFKG